MSTAATQVTIVVNSFNPKGDPRVRAMTEFALRCYRAFTGLPHELILVDGHADPDPKLAALCGELGYRYLNLQRRLAFAEGYNAGLREARSPWVVTAANDIFVVSGWLEALLAAAQRTGAWMTAPYLSWSDYPAQRLEYVIGRKADFAPSYLTFNLNLFSRRCLDTVGLIDEQFGGCFNDVDYTLRIREHGGSVALTFCGEITHLGRGTLSDAAVAEIYHRDLRLFEAKWPGKWDPKRFRLPAQGLLRFCFALESLLPGWWVKRYRELICRFEPKFRRLPDPRT
jgi:GT2 family glycosyltransferase